VREYDFQLNGNGQAMLESGRSREQIRKLAEVYLRSAASISAIAFSGSPTSKKS
jgi:hypothetical protein